MDHPVYSEKRARLNIIFAGSASKHFFAISYIVADASRVLFHKQKIVPRIISAEREK